MSNPSSAGRNWEEEFFWERIACLLTLARFCAQKSELSVAERWYGRTALEDLLGVSWDKINDVRLFEVEV